MALRITTVLCIIDKWKTCGLKFIRRNSISCNGKIAFGIETAKKLLTIICHSTSEI